ncbi:MULTISPECIES: CorA family divalent cation transporter [unclassified Sphingomonas]|uniref:CorA family divalent cation transporter n=1 Tax=unclassified Sphingomonas TaxID=196159 RepID=UPI000830C7C5|nr:MULTISPECIES: CorA family divalent cation transporter [unclassified Sphingomonas]MCH4894192.1 zinc transporter ZntB [Sphingomonas sp. SFZ2018-12]
MAGYAYIVGDAEVTKATPDAAIVASGKLVWIHLHETTQAARDWLINVAKLSELAADALTATETRPRCDALGEAALVNLRGLSTSTDMTMSDPLASIRIHAQGTRVLSVCRLPLNALGPVCARVAAGEVRDAGDLIAEIAVAITEELDPVIAELGDDLDDCEEMLDARKVFALRRAVSSARVQAIGYRRFLNPQRVAIEKLSLLPFSWLEEEDRLHLNAAADRAARMAEELEAIRERAALLHETLTDLRAELIDQRALAISVVAIVFLPLTFLTGLLGMNVDGIPYAHEPWAFWGVVAASTLVALATFGYFIRRRWFEQ